MSIQANFNKSALRMVPKTHSQLQSITDAFEAHQSVHKALQAILNTTPPLSEKSREELSTFDNDLVIQLTTK